MNGNDFWFELKFCTETEIQIRKLLKTIKKSNNIKTVT